MSKLENARGWLKAGTHPTQYEMGVDREVSCGEWSAGCIRSKGEEADGFGTLMQHCKADAFVGRRMRFSARTRTEGVVEEAGLWFRIDGTDGAVLGFDNMRNRPLTGTSDWTLHAVVLDVPAKSQAVAYGILLSGLGRVWIADVRLEPVGLDVPTTNMSTECALPESPVNLEFAR